MVDWKVLLTTITEKPSDLRFFEFGNVYKFNPEKAAEQNVTKKYTERQQLAIYLTGRKEAENWKNSDANIDFFDLKKTVFSILIRLGIKEKDITAEPLSGKSIPQGLSLIVRQKKSC